MSERPRMDFYDIKFGTFADKYEGPRWTVLATDPDDALKKARRMGIRGPRVRAVRRFRRR